MAYPYPRKKITDHREAEVHIRDLINNTMAWLKIDGYTFTVLFPEDEDHTAIAGAGLAVSVEHPYMKFNVSVQKVTCEQMLEHSIKAPLWVNLERSVFHEMCHVLLWNLASLARTRYTSPREIEDAEESTTDLLANILYAMLGEIRAYRKQK